MLQCQADDLAKKFGFSNFKCSSGWLSRFKERHNIVCKKICGEARSTPEYAILEWRSNHLPALLKQYNANDIYNADETVLFYRLLPNISLAEKNDKCIGGKQSKERLYTCVC